MDPINRFIAWSGETALRGLAWAGDGIVWLLFSACDGIAWAGHKMLGFCHPECPPLRMTRIDGFGDNPDEIILKCRRCGRVHRRKENYDGP